MKNPIAVQLYTLRQETAQDFVGTLRRVAQIGYGAVEFAGYGGLSAPALKKLLDDLNLRTCGSHMGMEELEADVPSAATYARVIGSPYLVIPAVPVEYRDDEAGFRRAGERMGKLARACTGNDIKLVYHTHGFDFQEFGGKLALECLLEAAAADELQVEIDTFWALDKGKDPAAMVSRFAGRCPLVHLKDKPAGGPAHDCEVGAGLIDFRAVHQAAQASGVEWLVVEQEDCRRPVEACIETSLANLRKLGIH